MTSRKYRPEIRRNRMVSNWVLARSSPKPLPRALRLGLRTSSVLVLAGLGLTFLVLSLSGQDFAVEQYPSAPELGRTGEALEPRITRTPTVCTVEDFAPIATRGSYSISTAPKLEGYEFDSKQAFGGLFAIDYRCNSRQNQDIFRVQLQLIDESWAVKKISRLPVK